MNINTTIFKNIGAEEYLNYTPYQKLESTISYMTPKILGSMKNKFEDINSDEAIYYFIEQSLLRLCINKNWTSISKTENLSENYLYVCLKRSFVFYTTK